jgi:multiple sugar transport system ATP-binding protein
MLYVTHDQTEAMTLGDRVAVMRGGVIQQVDNPKMLYSDPKNIFVAGFIGSPAMNFLPAKLEDGVVKLPFGEAPLPAGLRDAPRDVIAGIRPEHFDDARLAGAEAAGLRFRAKIEVVESLGAEEYVFFDVKAHAESESLRELAEDAGLDDIPRHGDRQEVVARVDATSQARTGAELELLLDTSHLKLFDPSSGASLTH